MQARLRISLDATTFADATLGDDVGSHVVVIYPCLISIKMPPLE